MMMENTMSSVFRLLNTKSETDWMKFFRFMAAGRGWSAWPGGQVCSFCRRPGCARFFTEGAVATRVARAGPHRDAGAPPALGAPEDDGEYALVLPVSALERGAVVAGDQCPAGRPARWRHPAKAW